MNFLGGQPLALEIKSTLEREDAFDTNRKGAVDFSHPYYG